MCTRLCLHRTHVWPRACEENTDAGQRAAQAIGAKVKRMASLLLLDLLILDLQALALLPGRRLLGSLLVLLLQRPEPTHSHAQE